MGTLKVNPIRYRLAGWGKPYLPGFQTRLSALEEKK